MEDEKLKARLRSIPTFAELKHFLGEELLPAMDLPANPNRNKRKVRGTAQRCAALRAGLPACQPDVC
jgi:hypothetical protein